MELLQLLACLLRGVRVLHPWNRLASGHVHFEFCGLPDVVLVQYTSMETLQGLAGFSDSLVDFLQ